jgi:hypothetical protein
MGHKMNGKQFMSVGFLSPSCPIFLHCSDCLNTRAILKNNFVSSKFVGSRFFGSWSTSENYRIRGENVRYDLEIIISRSFGKF